MATISEYVCGLRNCGPLAGLVLAFALGGCSKEAVSVSESTIAPDEATYFFLSSDDDQERSVFSTEDRQVTLSVRFSYNLVATYFLYHVNWIAPAGHVYLKGQIRTEYGTHRELTTVMPVKGEAPEQMPGRWRVELYLSGRLLTTREFDIVAPPRVCPPLSEPPGLCVDRLRNE